MATIEAFISQYWRVDLSSFFTAATRSQLCLFHLCSSNPVLLVPPLLIIIIVIPNPHQSQTQPNLLRASAFKNSAPDYTFPASADLQMVKENIIDTNPTVLGEPA